MKMDNVKLAVLINNAAVKYECDLDDGISERVAADNFINDVVNILADVGVKIEPANYYDFKDEYRIETITIPMKYYKLSDSAGNEIISSDNDDIFAYTE
jgi:hypothetical protein